jgi:hypothetical protein
VPVKLKFPGEKFYLVIPPIHPPLGGIKVLSVTSEKDEILISIAISSSQRRKY